MQCPAVRVECAASGLSQVVPEWQSLPLFELRRYGEERGVRRERVWGNPLGGRPCSRASESVRAR